MPGELCGVESTCMCSVQVYGEDMFSCVNICGAGVCQLTDMCGACG